MIFIGDVHGHYDVLMRLMEKLPHDEVCFVGDLIDRGSDSKKVVEFIRSNNYHCVMGNHEDFMIKSFDDSGNLDGFVSKMWDMNGGLQTRGSYGGTWDIMLDHREWMKGLPVILKFNDVIVSHSYFLPYLYHPKTDDVVQDIMWGREKKEIETNLINIHGHTPVSKVSISKNYINVDTGCFVNWKEDYGRLSAYDHETGMIYDEHNRYGIVE